MRLDNRGISIGIARFLLTLAVGGVMIYLVTEMGSRILPGAKEATTNETARQATSRLQQFPELMPIIVLVIAVFGLLVLAVYRRELGR